MAHDDQDLCAGDYVCALTGINKSDLQRLVANGVIPKGGRDKYHPVRAVRAYIDYLRSGLKTETTTQKEIADRLDLSERKFRDISINLGVDHKTHTFDQILVAYIRDLREKAAGRAGDAQKDLALAKTRDAIAGARLKEASFYASMGSLVSSDDLDVVLGMWAAAGKNELENARDRFVEAIETTFSIEIPPEMIENTYDTVFTSIARVPSARDPGGIDAYLEEIIAEGGE